MSVIPGVGSAVRRIRLVAVLCAVLYTLSLCMAGGATAGEFSFRACSESVGGDHIDRTWLTQGVVTFNVFEDCSDTTYMRLLVPSFAELGPTIATMDLRTGPVKAVDLVIGGGDLASDGLDFAFAVCRGPIFPEDCGTPLRGAQTPPYTPSAQSLTIANGGIPDGADRLMLYGTCTRNYPDLCTNTSDHVDISSVFVTATDDQPPHLFDAPPSSINWYRTPPTISGYVTDDLSGLSTMKLSSAFGGKTMNLCDAATNPWGCPISATYDMTPSTAILAQGLNHMELTASDSAGNTATRQISVRYDSKPPSPPTDITVGAINGWVVGSRVNLRWWNPGENEPTASASGIAGAKVEFSAPEDHSLIPKPVTVMAPGISSIPIDLPFSDPWTLTLTTFDAAGNQSVPRSISFSNQTGTVGTPQLYPLRPVNSVNEQNGLTVRWGGAPTAQSGICGARGWIGIGSPPSLQDERAPVIDNGRDAIWTITPSGLLKLADGLNTVAIAMVDCIGLVGPTKTAQVVIDRVRPVVTLSPSGGWSTQRTVHLDASDPGQSGAASGVASLWYRLDDGPRTVLATDRASLTLDPGMHTVSFGAADAAGNESTAETTLIGVDDEPPRSSITPVSGDPGRFLVSIEDPDSGIVDAWTEIRPARGGAWTRIGDRFVSTDSLRTPLTMTFHVPDDGTLADGDYRLRTVVRDDAGNVQAEVARTIQLPLRARSVLSAGIARSPRRGVARRSVTQNPGKRSYLRGRLRDSGGRALANATMRVVAQRDGVGDSLLGSVRTRTDGSFTVRLRDDVSRTLTVHYDGDAQRGPAATMVRQTFRAKVSLRASKRVVRRGDSVSLYGSVRLLSASVPSVGKAVSASFCSRSRCSSLELAGRLDSDGRFRIPVPTRVLRPTRYRFVVRVPAESGWPFAGSHSRAVEVVIR